MQDICPLVYTPVVSANTRKSMALGCSLNIGKYSVLIHFVRLERLAKNGHTFSANRKVKSSCPPLPHPDCSTMARAAAREMILGMPTMIVPAWQHGWSSETAPLCLRHASCPWGFGYTHTNHGTMQDNQRFNHSMWLSYAPMPRPCHAACLWTCMPGH